MRTILPLAGDAARAAGCQPTPTRRVPTRATRSATLPRRRMSCLSPPTTRESACLGGLLQFRHRPASTEMAAAEGSSRRDRASYLALRSVPADDVGDDMGVALRVVNAEPPAGAELHLHQVRHGLAGPEVRLGRIRTW